MSNIKLEVGKYYVDGAGRAIKITFKRSSGQSKYPFYGASSWFSEGGKQQGGGKGENLINLLKELPTISEIVLNFNQCTAEEYTKMVVQYCIDKISANDWGDTYDLSADIQSL
jgi:hypothetical protein